MAEKIVVVEDDESIREVIEIALGSTGYQITGFDNALDAIDYIKTNVVDLAIFDVMLPKISGIEAIKIIRQTNSQLPILILSAKDREIDKVTGLDSGGDDYLAKPFGILELQARVRALIRRKKTTVSELKTPTLAVNLATRVVTQNGNEVDLTNKEYQLLIYLLENRNRVVARDELLNEIWGFDFMGESRALDVHVRALRSKLDTTTTKYIATTRGVGYRFEERKNDE